MMKKYRKNGAAGALLDEYEKALTELIDLLDGVEDHELSIIVDDVTKDLDCKSIQTVLTHVISAGYNYIVEIRRSLGEEIPFRDKQKHDTVRDYQSELKQMFSYNEKLFEDYPDLVLEETDPTKKMTVRWGQQYDVEQLLEHAIVHILRHRRQLEKFLMKIRP